MNLYWLVVIVVVYLSVIGYLGYRGFSQTKNSADYMLGGRNIHPYIMAMSYGATFISTSAIIGFGGTAAQFGMSLLWLTVFNIFFGIFIAFVFFGKRTRRMGLNLDAHTFPELIGRRVGSPFIQRFMGLIIFVIMPLYAAAVLIGASRIIEGLLGVPYIYSVVIFSILVAAYVILGGLKGVMYTDALQGSIMVFGMLVLLFFIYTNLGGLVSAHTALTNLADLVPEGLKAIGHQGWTASPGLGTPLWWIVYSSLVLGVGIGVLAQPQLVVRYMTVRSNRELNRAVLIGSVFILLTVGTAFIVGSLSNVYFQRELGEIAIVVAEGNSDKVMPAFIREAMPMWFGYLFMLVILSAGMSTLSSQFHTIGTSVGRDLYAGGELTKDHKRRRELLITRIGIAAGILFTVFLSLRMGAGVIARATAIFFGVMASSFLAPYFASLYWKRLTRKGAIAGIVSGIATAAFAFLFLHGSEARVFGVAAKLFGRETLLGGSWSFVDPLVFALPVSVVFTIVISLVTSVEDKELVTKSMKGM
ncbi:MAG: sodium:solute symporter family protein [Spirochaetales bacterium]|nr:sodium:solute symporter family protein [Spirochaetales bacterium]MCF7938022.1 sodium:solute symporter family protein [Spirochaetales bacterium]